MDENTLVNGQPTNAQTQFLSYSGGLVSAPLQPTRAVPYAPQQSANGLGTGYTNGNSYQKGRTYFSNIAPGQSGALPQKGFYTNSLGGYRAFPSQPDTDAFAIATGSRSGLYPPSFMNSHVNGNMYSVGNSGNGGDYLAQTKHSIYFPNSNSYQYAPLNTAQPSVMQVLPTPDVYPTTYSRPGYNLPPLMGSNWGTSKMKSELSESLFVHL